MKYFLFLTLFAFFHSLSAQSYSSCFSYSYSSYYYYYSPNGALCCYKYSYRGSYRYTYVYCPYYTYATTPAPGSCYYYYYSSYYRTECCIFRDYSYSSSNYGQYCPSTSNLSSQCGTSCCTAYTTVHNGYDTFYYPQYFCPNVHSIYSYCGPFCGMAIAFGLMGYCFCICGLGFAISSFVIFGLLMNAKVKKYRNKSTCIVEHQPPPQFSGDVQGNTDEYMQEWEQPEDPPPHFHGYTYDPNPVNVPDTVHYPPQVANTQVIFNSAVVPTYFEANEQLKTNNLI